MKREIWLGLRRESDNLTLILVTNKTSKIDKIEKVEEG